MASSPPATFARLPSLTGLRFVAASGVFVCHITFFDALRKGGWPDPATFLLGPVGVSLFFVLSGFVLTVSARGTDTARSFWRRRIVKIYPNHLVVWAAIMVLVWGVGMPRTKVAPGPGATLLGDLANALLVHTFVPLPQFGFAGNGVAWSLSCELLFYLLFPWLLPWVMRIRPGLLPAAAVAAVAAAWAVPLISLAMGGPLVDQGYLPGDITAFQMLFVYLCPPCRLPEFVLGMILARMHANGAPVRIGVVPSAVLLGAVLLVGIEVLPPQFLLAAGTLLPIALLVRATAALDTRGARSPLRSPGMVFLGDTSYAFYLVHATVIAAVLHYSGGTWGMGWIACCSAAVALTAAWLLYTLVERPCMRRFAVRRPSPPAAVPVLPDGNATRNPDT